MNIPPRDWVEGTPCGNTDPELFFPDKGQSPKPAQRICGGCPARTDCLAWAMTNGADFGIWGGLTARQRRQLRKATRKP